MSHPIKDELARAYYDHLTREQEKARTESKAAFDTALATGRLTKTMGQPNYVGDYMYMGTHPKTGRAAFKHRDTREYLK